ncbi:hypothetical protein N658DRAFT_160302 [Parathielavia hyrcaniae]|uniref:Uncharacterized protein n=1 Tax=Parathielavia hyrcaniae TaxID=113614 RepID=A0AAN6SZU4_9PEZI|nr:hypothetical protein N658DRAFT_160302 [Parathielavia hyrcaniae]
MALSHMIRTCPETMLWYCTTEYRETATMVFRPLGTGEEWKGMCRAYTISAAPRPSVVVLPGSRSLVRWATSEVISWTSVCGMFNGITAANAKHHLQSGVGFMATNHFGVELPVRWVSCPLLKAQRGLPCLLTTGSLVPNVRYSCPPKHGSNTMVICGELAVLDSLSASFEHSEVRNRHSGE